MKIEVQNKVQNQLKFCDDLWRRIYKNKMEHPYQLANDIKRLRRELNEVRKMLEKHWMYER